MSTAAIIAVAVSGVAAVGTIAGVIVYVVRVLKAGHERERVQLGVDARRRVELAIRTKDLEVAAVAAKELEDAKQRLEAAHASLLDEVAELVRQFNAPADSPAMAAALRAALVRIERLRSQVPAAPASGGGDASGPVPQPAARLPSEPF